MDDTGAYYTMELLDGQDLRELGKVDWRRACELLRDIASSLSTVHSRRLLHCDVAPRNVRCTAQGRAKLIDFGAMAVMGMSHRVVGTPPCLRGSNGCKHALATPKERWQARSSQWGRALALEPSAQPGRGRVASS